MAVAGVVVRSRVASAVRCALTIGLVVPLGVATSSARVEALIAAPNVVTTTDDVVANDGACSLREAIIAANTASGSTPPAGECTDGRLRIELQANATYVVTSGALPVIMTSVTLNGNGATIESNVASRVLQTGTAPGSNDVELNDLTVTHRFSDTGIVGRGLYVRGNAVITNVQVVDNEEVGPGGGVYNEGTTTITSSVIDDNSTGTSDGTRDGGGIYNTATGDLTISGSTITSNDAERRGGGIVNFGALAVTESTISGNMLTNDPDADNSYGGGIDATGDTTLIDTDISGNEAKWGGGLSVRSVAEVTVQRGTIADNIALVGGGVYHVGASLDITGTAITGNHAGSGDGGGGGLTTINGDSTSIDGAVISNNSAVHQGGGIWAANATITDSMIDGNLAAESAGANLRDSSLVGTTIQNNVASVTIGGLDARNSTIDRTTIADNRSSGSTGGARLTDGSTLSDSTVTDNEAVTTGGGLSVVEATVERSTVSGNTAGWEGGGIRLSHGSTVTNSTISGNTSDQTGGGIHTLFDTTIRFSTITDNTAANGSGLHHYPEGNTEGATLTASIVAGNHGGLDVELDPTPGPQLDGNINSLGYNVIGSVGDDVDGFTATGDLVDADPKLDALAENGGPTLTHQPQPDSPAIDRVPAGSPLIVSDEQRGLVFRPVGGGADSGAIECCEPPFIVITPTRIVDTRTDGETYDGQFAGDGAIEGNTIYEVTVGGREPFPDQGALIMNVTTVDSLGNGFLTIFDCDEQPLASSINYAAGRTANNEVIAELGDSGTFCVFAKTTTHVVIDAVGFARTLRQRYEAITPARLLETRSGGGLDTIDGEFEGVGAIEGDTELELQITGRDGVVGSNATAVVVNLSTVGSLGNGFLTIHDCEDRPLASGINYSADGVVNNEIVTRLSERGTICVYAKTTTHVVVDAVGYLLPGSSYRSVTPARLLETRPGLTTIDGQSQGGGAIASDDMIEVQIAGRGGVTPDSTRAMVNVSALTGTGNGFLTIWNCGKQPLASAINYGPGRVVNNEVLVALSETGTICIYAKTTAHVIIDVVGFSNGGFGAT